MPILVAEGRRGWHLVDFGPSCLVVEASSHQWKHRRVTLPAPATRQRLADDGWVPAGTWFPFRYYKRPLPAPAEAAGAARVTA